MSLEPLLLRMEPFQADFCFIPEWPPPTNWREILCQKLAHSRSQGQRLNIIIVAEGAIDREGQPITSNLVRHLGHI